MTNMAEATTSDGFNESQLVPNFLQCGIPLVTSVFIGYNQLRALLLVAMPEMRNDVADESIGN